MLTSPPTPWIRHCRGLKKKLSMPNSHSWYYLLQGVGQTKQAAVSFTKGYLPSQLRNGTIHTAQL